MSARPRILVVGYSAFDVTVRLARLPAPDSKLEVPPILLGGGGPGATAAVALARLGADVRLLTALTDDEGGRTQRRELEAAGVDIGPSPVLPGAACARAVILVDPADGRRTILWSRGDLPHLPEPADADALLADRDLLLIDGHEPAAAAATARVARRRGLPVVMDAGTVREGSRTLVPLCTDVVAATGFAPAYTSRGEPAAALRALQAEGPARAASTFGPGGMLGLEDGRLVAVPAWAVEAVDTTGAGDAFHAGYAFALGRGAGFAEALRWGAAVAALKCRDWGGRRGLPTLREAEDFLASARPLPLDPAVAAAVSPPA